MRRWGRAGVPLTPEEIEQRDHARRQKANRERLAERAMLVEAYRRWRAGLVCPAMITQVLDAKGLYGPEVDRACRAEEPEVDQWEGGERYPSWEQLRALAELTGVLPAFLTDNTHPPIPQWKTSMWNHMTEEERIAYRREWKPPIMTYPRAVLDARPPSPEMPPEL